MGLRDLGIFKGELLSIAELCCSGVFDCIGDKETEAMPGPSTNAALRTVRLRAIWLHSPISTPKRSTNTSGLGDSQWAIFHPFSAGFPDGSGPQQQFAGALRVPWGRFTRDRAGHEASEPAAAPGGPSAGAARSRGHGQRGSHRAGGGAGGVPPMDLPVAGR